MSPGNSRTPSLLCLLSLELATSGVIYLQMTAGGGWGWLLICGLQWVWVNCSLRCTSCVGRVPRQMCFSCSFASAWVCSHPYAMLSGLDIQHDGWLTPTTCTHVVWTVSLPQTAPCRRAGHSGWSEGGRGTAVIVSRSWQPEFRSLDWTFLLLHPLLPLFFLLHLYVGSWTWHGFSLLRKDCTLWVK